MHPNEEYLPIIISTEKKYRYLRYQTSYLPHSKKYTSTAYTVHYFSFDKISHFSRKIFFIPHFTRNTAVKIYKYIYVCYVINITNVQSRKWGRPRPRFSRVILIRQNPRVLGYDHSATHAQPFTVDIFFHSYLKLKMSSSIQLHGHLK